MEIVLAVLAILVVVAAVTVGRGGAVTIVPVHHVGAVERLGRYQRLVEPGLHLVVPYIDSVHRIDTREQTLSLPVEELLTTDSMIVSLTIDLSYRIVDPYKARYEIQDIPTAADVVVKTHLRTALGDADLEEVLSSSYKIQANLSEALRETTRAWGVEVSKVDLKDVSYRPVTRT